VLTARKLPKIVSITRALVHGMKTFIAFVDLWLENLKLSEDWFTFSASITCYEKLAPVEKTNQFERMDLPVLRLNHSSVWTTWLTRFDDFITSLNPFHSSITHSVSLLWGGSFWFSRKFSFLSLVMEELVSRNHVKLLLIVCCLVRSVLTSYVYQSTVVSRWQRF